MIKAGNSSQRRHRLPEQSRVPEVPDLEYMFGEAAKQPGHVVELPWAINRQPFVLTTKLERRNNEQSHQWSFYRGDGADSKLEWNYETSDIVMIHSLIMTAFPSDDPVTDRALLATLQPQGYNNGQQSGPQQIVGQNSNAQQSGSQPRNRQARGVMEGSLADMPLHSLLNSIQSSRLTGRLNIHTQEEESDIYFEEGAVVACQRPQQEGDEAFIEVALNSSSGDFKFFDSDVTQKKTIKLRLDALMLTAASLSDHTRYLGQKGLKHDSCLMRANPNITEKEFESKVNALVPVDMSLQKRMYQAIDNKILFADLIGQCGLVRSVWTPLIFNLVSAGIVNVENKVEEVPTKVVSLDQTGSNPTIDLVALEKFTSSLARRDTGIYTEIAFLFFLEHEFYRFHSYDTGFTIALFRLTQPQGGPTPDGLNHALNVVKSTVRKADILGHYEGDDYAVILPHTDPNAALGLFRRVQTLLQQPPFAPNEIQLSIGIAGIPQDCQDLTSLLKIARMRKTAKK
jgi:hypothetical protein